LIPVSQLTDAGILGLRIAKKQINFDAFGNEAGSPGTNITIIPFEHGCKSRIWDGQVGVTTHVEPDDAASVKRPSIRCISPVSDRVKA
jgi:hypothetical protein